MRDEVEIFDTRTGKTITHEEQIWTFSNASAIIYNNAPIEERHFYGVRYKVVSREDYGYYDPRYRATNATCHNCSNKMVADETHYRCLCGFKIQLSFPWGATYPTSSK